MLYQVLFNIVLRTRPGMISHRRLGLRVHTAGYLVYDIRIHWGALCQYTGISTRSAQLAGAGFEKGLEGRKSGPRSMQHELRREDPLVTRIRPRSSAISSLLCMLEFPEGRRIGWDLMMESTLVRTLCHTTPDTA